MTGLCCLNRRRFITGSAALAAMPSASLSSPQTMTMAIPDWVGLAFDHGAGPEGLWIDIGTEVSSSIQKKGGPLILVERRPAAAIYGDLAVGRTQLAMLPLGAGAPPPGSTGAVRRVARVHGEFGYVAVTRRGRRVRALTDFVGSSIGVPSGSCCFPGLSDDPTIVKTQMESEAAPLMTLHGRIDASVVLDLDFGHYIDTHGFDPAEFRVARMYDPLNAWVFAHDGIPQEVDGLIREVVQRLQGQGLVRDLLDKYRRSAPPIGELPDIR
ncbi:MAG: hypothetical protein AAF360_11880 [Pseudomonadota bacterium]